jgi:hypothetical protein
MQGKDAIDTATAANRYYDTGIIRGLTARLVAGQSTLLRQPPTAGKIARNNSTARRALSDINQSTKHL